MSKVEKKIKGKGIMNPQVKENQRKFPAGIRVLVVDDDETCLLWVENLLLTCNFKATTTLYAREAIEMLRKNKDDFDLVITDVQMPEIDGFQLLETIGLEMDLPVIMMSIYSHQQYVQKGVQHGAVDYLVKPVRLEEIQNVWQHVLRKRKDLVKEKREEYRAKLNNGSVSGALADTAFSAGDTSNNKRCREQQQSDDDEDDSDNDSGRDNEATKTKKPRVVWNAVLHRKFVAAVNHLGLDKAVPKRILELMDTDTSLTRENIASHLQKYRMFLKKLEAERNTPEGGLGGRNSLEAMNYIGVRYPNSMPPEFAPRRNGLLRGPLNIGGISSSELIRSGQNLRNSICTRVKLQPNNSLPSPFLNGNSLQGIIGGFEQSLPLAGNDMSHLGSYNQDHVTTGLELSDYFMDPKMLMNGFNGNGSLMTSGTCQFSQTTGFNDSWKPVVPNLQGSLQQSRSFTGNQLLMNGNTSSANQQLLVGFPSMSAVTGECTNLRDNVSFPLTQGCDNGKNPDYSQDLSGIFESLNPITAPSSSNGIIGSVTATGQNSLVVNGDNFITTSQTIGHPNGVHEHVTLQQDDFISNTIESMDDIMNSITTRVDNNEPSSSIFMDDELNFAAEGPVQGL